VGKARVAYQAGAFRYLLPGLFIHDHKSSYPGVTLCIKCYKPKFMYLS